MISFCNQDSKYLPGGRRRLAAWVKSAIAAEECIAGDINFVFCSPEYHIGINREYLGHDYHTDVITFDYSDLAGTKVVAGDILIDPEQVARQSVEWNTTPEDEMHRVMIHGVLHLCGYGDKSSSEQCIMRSKEDFYLSML